jgi:hypothetical protein
MLLEVMSRVGAVAVDGLSRCQPPRWVLQALLKLQAATLLQRVRDARCSTTPKLEVEEQDLSMVRAMVYVPN